MPVLRIPKNVVTHPTLLNPVEYFLALTKLKEFQPAPGFTASGGAVPVGKWTLINTPVLKRVNLQRCMTFELDCLVGPLPYPLPT